MGVRRRSRRGVSWRGLGVVIDDGDDDGVDDDDVEDVTIIADVGVAARMAELVDDSADGGVGAADGQGGCGHAINFGGYESDTEWDADNGEEDSGSNQYVSRES